MGESAGELYVRVTIDPVLTYVAHAINNSPAESIKKACRGFYTQEELTIAKEILWKVGDEDELPPYTRRRDVGKVVDDLVSGIQKLDAADKLPDFAVGPLGLGRVPKATPAEMHPISVCERLNKLEARVHQLDDLEVRMNDAEGLLKKVTPTYAAVAASPPHSAPSMVASLVPPRQSVTPATAAAAAAAVSSSTTAPSAMAAQRPPHLFAPPAAAVGGLVVKLPPPRLSAKATKQPTRRPPPSASLPDHYGSRASLVSTVPSHHDEGFEYSAAEQSQRRRRKNRDTRKTVTGSSLAYAGKLTGAPEPSRDIFVYRTIKGTQEQDIHEYLESKNVDPRTISEVSNEDAKFSSFKVELKVSDIDTVLKADFWPQGICVRRFYRPRSSSEKENNKHYGSKPNT